MTLVGFNHCSPEVENSSPRKVKCWKIQFPLGYPIFRGKLAVSFRECTHLKFNKKKLGELKMEAKNVSLEHDFPFQLGDL